MAETKMLESLNGTVFKAIREVADPEGVET